MRTVWEFTVGYGAPQVLNLPKGAKFLTIAPNGSFSRMWFEVDPDARPYEQRTFIPMTSGQMFDENFGSYVCTMLLPGSTSIAVHVYEAKQ